jgi:hypothetical protein
MDRLRLETTIGNARARTSTTFAGVTRAVSAFIEANMIV